MKETKIYADEFCTTFASTTEMLEFLVERAKQSKWIRKPTRMLKLVPLEKEAETIEEACEKELEGIVEDTEKNTQLVLKVNKDFYPVRDCAIHTILKRAGINGTGLKKLEKATYAKVAFHIETMVFSDRRPSRKRRCLLSVAFVFVHAKK